MPQIACCQFDIAWEDKPANFKTVDAMVVRAQLPPDSLLVLPEMFATGFTMNAEAVVESLEGPTHQYLSQLAARHRLTVVGGAVVRGPGGKPRNEALVFAPDGRRLARYAKMHPFSLSGEPNHYEAGSEVATFAWQDVLVTPFICYDLRFPELFRRAASSGTDLFLVIASWPAARTAHWSSLLTARAIENQAYVLGNNRVGRDPSLPYSGHSVIVDFNGQTLASGGETAGIVRADVDLASLRLFREKLPFLRDRRMDL